jgi:hypothetical protein
LHDISPFSHCRLYDDRAGRGDDKSAASPNTLRTHLIVSASHAVVDRQKTKPMALLYRMLMTHHKPCGTDISKTCVLGGGIVVMLNNLGPTMLKTIVVIADGVASVAFGFFLGRARAGEAPGAPSSRKDNVSGRYTAWRVNDAW